MTREVLIREGSVGKRLMDRYMAQPFDFGGKSLTRLQIYEWFIANGFPERAADYWLMGAEKQEKADERRDA